MLLLLLRLLTLDPIAASHVAAALVDSPISGAELADIARRESRGRWVSVHEGDRWIEEKAHRGALEAGWLQSWCPFHQDADGMGTRGAHGQVFAYAARFLVVPCLPPQVLDIPLLSAIAAARRARTQCRVYGACTRRERRLMWRSVAAFKRDQAGA